MNHTSKFTAFAFRTLERELKAIRGLSSHINDAFAQILEEIHHCKGRLVITGIGKSALIARKMVATFNSTGTPAIFLHASDAIHGDFGIVQQEDLILCLSKSGETLELKMLIPLILNKKVPLIAMTAQANSYLAKAADYVLLTPIESEADAHNLVPTCSTTAQLVMGDCMAIALAGVRGFDSSDFAKVHPAGTLGKRLHLKVRDLYPKNEKPKVDKHTSINALIYEISSKRLGATAVVDEEEQLVGIITDGDIRRMLENYPDFKTLRAEDIMSIAPISIEYDALAVDALELIQKKSITQLPVVHKGKYVGLIHLHDLVHEGIV